MNRPFTVVDGSEFAGRFDLLPIDSTVFGPLHPEEYLADFGDQEQQQSWFQRNPSIFTFLCIDDQIAGYINAVPLVDDAFEQILAGTLRDGQITADMIRTYDEPGAYSLYLCSIGVLPELRTDLSAMFSLNSLVYQKFDWLESRGIVISQIASIAWTRAGEVISRSLGMTFYGKHPLRGEVYYLKPQDGRFPRF
jgi:hypothetical protein